MRALFVAVLLTGCGSPPEPSFWVEYENKNVTRVNMDHIQYLAGETAALTARYYNYDEEDARIDIYTPSIMFVDGQFDCDFPCRTFCRSDKEETCRGVYTRKGNQVVIGIFDSPCLAMTSLVHEWIHVIMYNHGDGTYIHEPEFLWQDLVQKLNEEFREFACTEDN